jgi:hypothetical protein
LFNALPCCNSYAESGKGTFEQTVGVSCRPLYRTKNHLVLCSGLIFGLIGDGPVSVLLRVTECVGVAAAMHALLPALTTEQIGAAFADAGDDAASSILPTAWWDTFVTMNRQCFVPLWKIWEVHLYNDESARF